MQLKVLSYNLYGIKETTKPTPVWKIRQKNIERILNDLLIDSNIKLCCFQEVNENNIDFLNKILIRNNFKMLDKFPMKSKTLNIYNILAIRNDIFFVNKVYCIPHSSDEEYKNIEEQIIDYNMSDYRTTVFVNFNYENKSYLIGNIHTDYISTEGKINGVLKSLNYMDGIDVDYKMLVGDMNMVSHMSEVYKILSQNDNYVTLSRSKKFDISDNSYHGYGTQEQINVDFAFIYKYNSNKYEYQIIKQKNMFDEGSDHRPIIITII